MPVEAPVTRASLFLYEFIKTPLTIKIYLRVYSRK